MPLLALVLVMSFAVHPIFAIDCRAITGRPSLRIKGTTAYCEATYHSGNKDAEISVTLTLKQGNNIIDSWSGSGKSLVIISETSTVERGKTYELVLNATVNGTEQPEVSVSAQAS